jgi:hypothetical protein
MFDVLMYLMMLAGALEDNGFNLVDAGTMFVIRYVMELDLELCFV